MPLAPIHRLKKSEILWLARHKCQHRHSFLEHYNCYLQENPLTEKIAFFDIETSNLAASFGIMFCYCLKPAKENKIYERVITDNELHTCLDRNVVKTCIDDLSRFDRIIGFYSKPFDVAFVRTRAIMLGLEFPTNLIHNDIYYVIRNRFRLHRNRLETACQSLLGESSKTHLDPQHWIRALQGNLVSLTYILKHCRADVQDLEKLYYKVIEFCPRQDSLI